MKRVFGLFFSHSRVWHTSGDNIWGSTRYFDNYCGSYRVNSVTHKKLLKTQLFERKGKFSSDEKISAIFLAHSGVWQTSVNTLIGSAKFFDNYCGSHRINSVIPKKLLKTKTFEKKGKLSSEKSFWPVFSLILESDKPQGKIYEGPQGILTNTVEVTGLILLHLRGCWKHKFLKKKANFPVKKRFWPNFWRILEFDKPQLTRYTGQQSFLTITVEVTGLIL